jgi:hypothetical protein
VDFFSGESLIDKIYEAAVIPDLWKPVLDKIGYRVNGAGAGLFLVSNRNASAAIWSDALHEVCTGWIEGGWQTKTQRAHA